MADQFTFAETCRVCGAPLSKDSVRIVGLCEACAQMTPAVSEIPPRQAAPDPDHPAWGPSTGIGVWLLSVVAIIVLPLMAVMIWYFIQSGRGAPVPNLTAREELYDWLKQPTLLLVQVLSTIVAHVVTIAICWAAVTKLGTRPFWASLGWNWAGRSAWYWVVFSACVLVGLILISQLLARFLPESEENAFAELLKSSQSVRVAIAILATFSAPFVEETVYRGVLFAALRRYLGPAVTVVVITLLFAGVHVVQYWGAWVSIAGLTLLSLTLTVVRAKTKSILPCVLIHTLNNAFFSVFIVLNKAS